MTPEIRQSEIKGFIRVQKEQGGIIPTKLADGTKILVETDEFMYELTVLTDRFPTPRFILATASPTCKSLGNILLGVCTRQKKLKYDMDDWVGKDAGMLLKFQNGTCVLTTNVTGATIVSKRKDGSEYTYDLWN